MKKASAINNYGPRVGTEPGGRIRLRLPPCVPGTVFPGRGEGDEPVCVCVCVGVVVVLRFPLFRGEARVRSHHGRCWDGLNLEETSR